MEPGKRILTAAAAFALAAMALAPTAIAGDDFGMSYNASAVKKFNKQWSLGAEAEFRTRNDAGTADRWSGALEASYKPIKYLKLSAEYKFLYDNNREKTTYHTDGTPNNRRPSYWGARHRFSLSATGSIDVGRLEISLRERWQYTYRPEKTTTRYDYDNEIWEDKTVRSTNKHVLRSRLQLQYDIRHCPVSPFASVELFNNWSLDKVRYTAGIDYKLTKQHSLEAFYRFQTVNDRDDDNEVDTHLLGLGYKFTF